MGVEESPLPGGGRAQSYLRERDPRERRWLGQRQGCHWAPRRETGTLISSPSGR